MGTIAQTIQTIDRSILSIRGQRVILDDDLARLYEVETGALNRAVKRNVFRFPADFMFQLTTDEQAWALKCQSGISKGRGGRRYRPFAFTEQGVAMLSSVLSSRRAIEVNIEIMRAFVRLRHILAANADIANKLDALEAQFTKHQHENAKRHADHEKHIRVVFETLRRLLGEDKDREPPSRIGFDIT
jgi:phage regulator Rha-like protein